MQSCFTVNASLGWKIKLGKLEIWGGFACPCFIRGVSIIEVNWTLIGIVAAPVPRWDREIRKQYCFYSMVSGLDLVSRHRFKDSWWTIYGAWICYYLAWRTSIPVFHWFYFLQMLSPSAHLKSDACWRLKTGHKVYGGLSSMGWYRVSSGRYHIEIWHQTPETLMVPSTIFPRRRLHEKKKFSKEVISADCDSKRSLAVH
jgi:hypothetical protein